MSDKIVMGYRHTGIIVENMAASLHFYRDLLGLNVIQDFSDDSEYINTITGMTGGNVHMIKLETEDKKFVIELLEYLNHPTKLVKQPIYNVGCCHVAFQVRNIDSAYERLSKAGVRFLSGPVLSSEKIAKVCFCMDPSDIRVELVEML
jgi:catechol 2,3-dioxygenase-like lactoylglutathione lyase family enzyme